MRFVIGVVLLLCFGMVGLVVHTEMNRPAPADQNLGLGVIAGSSLHADGTRKITTISTGEAVDIEEHTVPGKLTVVEFMADWCAACTELGPQLDALIMEVDGVTLRRIALTDWECEVAQQHGIQSLPTLWLYDGTKRISTSGHEVMQRLLARREN